MSHIPKPKMLPSPKRLRTTDDLDSAEHQALLDLLWGNLETVAVAWLQRRPEWLEGAAESARQEFKKKAADVLREMECCLKEKNDPGGKVSGAKERFEEALSAVIFPPPPEEALLSKLSRKQYQQPITVVKYDRRGQEREEVVGYVDIGCELNLVSSLKIGGCPSYFPSLAWRGSPEEKANNLARLALSQVSWTIERNETLDIWFDVRSTLPRTGVLLQEMRVLQELSDERVMITLVCDEIPPSVAELLKHEGFWCLTRHDINELLAEKSEAPELGWI